MNVVGLRTRREEDPQRLGGAGNLSRVGTSSGPSSVHSSKASTMMKIGGWDAGSALSGSSSRSCNSFSSCRDLEVFPGGRDHWQARGWLRLRELKGDGGKEFAWGV